MAQNVEAAVEKIVTGLLQGSELELVDVEYVKEHDWYLRVFIDKEGGIQIDDCQQLSGRLEAILDSEDIVPGSYILEVSSPGIDRVLKKERDFARERGKAVDVKLYAPLGGSKELTGILAGFDEGSLTLATGQGDKNIPRNQIAQVRLHIEI